MKFAAKLKKLRTAAGLSEARLAQESGVPFGSIHEYGLGRRTPSFPAVIKIASALAVDCTDFANCDDMGRKDRPAKKMSRRKHQTGKRLPRKVNKKKP